MYEDYDSGYLGAFMKTYADHIPAQNQAGADLAAIVAGYQAVKASGTLNNAYIDAAQANALAVGQKFYDYTRTIGGSRALAGGDQIMSLAKQIAGDMDKDRTAITAPQAAVVPPVAVLPVMPVAPTADAPPTTIVVQRPPTTPGMTFAPAGGGGGPVYSVDPLGPPQTAPGTNIGDLLPWAIGGLALAYFLAKK